MNPLIWDIVPIGQALLWFIVLFNGILLAVTANNQLGVLRFSRGSLISCLGGSLVFWFAQTSYEMYGTDLASMDWVYVILYGLTTLHALWLICLVLLLGFARRRVIRFMQCHVCGYDLTSNESGTCPECGNEVDIPK